MSAGFMLYYNLLRYGSVIVDSDNVAGFDAVNSLDGRTTTYTRLNTGSTSITYDLGQALNFSHLCIARHNFDSTNTYISINVSSDNIDYSTQILSDTYITSGKNFWINLGLNTYRFVKINFNDSTKQPQWVDISLGVPLTLERSQKHGFIRPGLSDGDRIVSNVTRGRELAGLSLIEDFERIVFDLPLYSESFLNNYPVFLENIKQYPSYIVWDTSINAEPFIGGEPAFYCWPTSTMPKAKYSKDINGYYDLRLDMTGFYI